MFVQRALFLRLLLLCATAAILALHAVSASAQSRPSDSGSTTIAAIDALTLDRTLGRQCSECHQNAVEVSHPTDFTPRRTLPREFPLSRNGEMTCNTCHIAHEGGPGRLRVAASGQEFCLSCHSAGFFAQMRDRGQSVLALGHASARPRTTARIDAYSSQCIVCHTENASYAGDGITAQRSWRNASGSSNHPIGSDYARVASSRGFWQAAMLPEEVLLPNGKVSCVSCHAGYSKEHGKLLRPESLCLDCHNK